MGLKDSERIWVGVRFWENLVKSWASINSTTIKLIEVIILIEVIYMNRVEFQYHLHGCKQKYTTNLHKFKAIIQLDNS